MKQMAKLVNRPKIGQRSGMARMRKWAVLGRLALMARARKTGSALAVETEIANRFGLSRGTLRNYADAVTLVRDLPDPRLRSMLLRCSAVAASTVGRWFQRDAVGALDFLSMAGSPSNVLDDRALLTAERASRQAGLPVAGRRRPPTPLQRQLEDLATFPVVHLNSEFTGAIDWPLFRAKFSVRPADSKLEKFLGIAQVVTIKPPGSAEQPERRLGVIEIPVRVTLERYRAEARMTWSRALAASVYFDAVAVVLPSSAARRQLLASIPPEGAEWSHHRHEDGLELAGRRSCRSRPVVAKVPTAGAIILSTLRSIQHDVAEIQPLSRTI